MAHLIWVEWDINLIAVSPADFLQVNDWHNMSPVSQLSETGLSFALSYKVIY